MAAARRPQGRGLLLLLRLGALGLSLAFTFLFVTTVLTAPNLEFAPPGDDPSFRYEDGLLYVDTAFDLGIQDCPSAYVFPTCHGITNLTVFVRAVVEDTVSVTDYRSPPVAVAVGERRSVDVSIPLRLAPLVTTGYIVLRPANVSFTLGISGTTTRGFMDFAGSFTQDQLFDPLISRFVVDWENSTFVPENGNVTWTVPYTVGSADFLSGTADATVRVHNATSQLTEGATAIPLGQVANGTFSFTLSQEAAQDLATTPQTLRVEVAFTLPGDLTFTTETTVEWTGGA